MPTRPSKTIGTKLVPDVHAESFDRIHEALLIRADRELPGEIAEQVLGVAHLNDTLAALAAERSKSVEQYISEGKISSDQIPIWRQVPTIRFGSSGLPNPKVHLGRTLYRRFDSRGNRKLMAEALSIVDFAITFGLPQWWAGYLRTPDPKHPISSPEDAVEGISAQPEETEVLGLIIPSHIALGTAVRQIETTLEHGRLDSSQHGRDDGAPSLIVVTDSPTLFSMLVHKVDMMFAMPDRTSFHLNRLVSRVTAGSKAE